MQRLVRLHPHVVAVDQTVELRTRKCQHRIPDTRPVKAMTLKALVPENEAVALPHQNLELVTSGINESKHRARERILLDHIARQDREAIDLPSHVHGRTMQIYALDPP